MKITELRETSKGCFVVGFADGSEIKAALDTVADLSLFTGRELTDEEFADLSESARLSACKERALRIIGTRPMSCHELFKKLTEKGETEENAERCIEWLIGLHYLDDSEYAAMLVRHYAAKGYGMQRIKNELYRRGISKTLWDAAFEEMPETDDTVYTLLCRRLKGGEPDRAELKKATDALFRRGFSWDEIKAAVDRYMSEYSFD